MPSIMARQACDDDPGHHPDLDLFDKPFADQPIELRSRDRDGANRFFDRASGAFGERDDCLRLPEPLRTRPSVLLKSVACCMEFPSFQSRAPKSTRLVHEGNHLTMHQDNAGVVLARARIRYTESTG
jgi:hypothetical protein